MRPSRSDGRRESVVVKHVICQLGAAVFQGELSGLVGQDCAVFQVNEEVDRIFFRVEKKLVIGIFRIGEGPVP